MVEPLGKAVLTSTHNLHFESKLRKNAHLCIPKFHYIHVEVDYKRVYFSWICNPDETAQL